MTIMGRLAGAAALVLSTGLTFSGAAAQQVFVTDVVIQASLCVGFDCPDKPAFGSDTIILRENNLRIFFDDTSTSVGYAKNKWRIVINDTYVGGSSFFRIEDVTGDKRPFQITAGAPSNSLYVASNGHLGLQTSNPKLDLHILTGNTPAIRLEQDGSSAYTPQTWDIGGNEANFFIRDLTGGSRLPFRIRPGAPTSSLDIASTGKVGIGTTSAPVLLTVAGGFSAPAIDGNEIAQFAKPAAAYVTVRDDTGKTGIWGTNQGPISIGSLSNHSFSLLSNNAIRMTVDPMGLVGIGTTVPAAQLHTTAAVRFAGVPSCSSGIQSSANGTLSCLVSSRQFKTITGDLSPATALTNIMALRPQTGTYKETPDVPEHWLIAEDVALVDPALAGFKDDKPYTVKTQNVVADLVAVIQQQQRQIEQQMQRIEALEKAVSR